MYLSIAIQLGIIYVIQSTAQPDTQACSSCCTAGIPGIPGNHGMLGAKGEMGSQGNDGHPGSPGPVGTNGEKGNQGIDGNTGKLGPIGPKGESGLPATNGEKGQRGEKGEPAKISKHKSAFSATFNRNPGRLPVEPMKYNTIITNVGDDYDKNTGKFVCEHPGTYVFQVTSIKSSTGAMLTKIMKNGQPKASAWTFSSNYNSVSTMVVLDLLAFDKVWTQPHTTSHNYYYGDSGGQCTFSGFLLYAA